MSMSPTISGTTTAQPDRKARDAGLTDFEADHVRSLLAREPNDLEWAMFGAMWSEHCAYKHSKALLRTLPTTGARVALGPGENAGAVDLGDGLLCVFKVESHNHPSAVEPYQGAATGVGGILRDVFAMGARPVAVLNALFFGPPEDARTRRLVSGVVGGISFYGNCVGIPDVGGHVSFEPCYADNPLVNAMCVGVVERGALASASVARAGSAVYLVGSDTGRDGIGGASVLASFELDARTGGDAGDAEGGIPGVVSKGSKRPSVQVGNPFLEKLLLEATLELVAMDAVEAVQDLGAAGLTCATSEVAAKSGVGMRVDVDAVPRRAGGMSAAEVMLSESQERMLVVARPGRDGDVERVFARWGLHGTRIGEVTGHPVLEIRERGAIVASLLPRALADAAPEYELPSERPADELLPRVPVEPSRADVTPAERLLALMASPRIASRRVLYRTYDAMVGTDTVIGPGGDAAVLRIKGRATGIATAIDAQPRVAARDPYEGAAAAVAEAVRNVVCSGAEPLAITDCLNLGNPERPLGAWQLRETVRGIGDAAAALGTPVVSGNVSLYNATHGNDIWPTAVVGAVGRLADVRRHIPVTTGREGDLVHLAGGTAVAPDGVVPIDLALEARLHRFVLAAHQLGLVRAAHDRSDGGLAVALAELALRDGIGLRATLPDSRGVALDDALFGEGPSAIVLVAAPADGERLRALAHEHDVPIALLGTVGGDALQIGDALEVAVASLRRAYDTGLATSLGREG